ncbi:MAG: TraB/GumN family protein [Clostridia bacterium]|nr:TraB/GumN family protein [Clostridia bacterium]
MKIIKRLLAVLIIAVLVFTASSCGDGASSQKVDADIAASNEQNSYNCPLLWRVTDNNGGEMWLFGTIHVGNKNSKDVLERLQPTLEKCEALAVEFDAVSYAKDINAQTKDLSLFVYNDGTTISDHIPEQLYNSLVDTLKAEKLYNKLYENFKLGFWSLLINQALVSKSKLSSEKGMDTLLIKDANSANREILEVESASFQYEIFANAPAEYMLLSIEKDLESMDDAEAVLNELYNAWLIGDAQKIIESDEYYDLTEEEQRIVDDFDNELLTKRNLNMAKKAKEYINSGKTVFFAVGTMHFLGDDGIVALLEQEGYSVERVGF